MPDETTSPDRQIVRSEVLPPARGDSFDMGAAADGSNSRAVTSRPDPNEVIRIRQQAIEAGLPADEIQNLSDFLVGIGTTVSRRYLSRYIGSTWASILGAGVSDWLLTQLSNPQRAKPGRRQLKRYGQ